MSDKDSESSCEWIVLDEEGEDENEMEPSDEQLSSELIPGAFPVSAESLPSSLTGEELELEWQDDPIEFYDLSSYSMSHVENLDVEAKKEVKSSFQSDDTSTNVCDQQSSNEELDVDLATVHKVHCYKHTRNENLNFILNLMLVVSISSAAGLGTGYFLGWSHKCWTHMIEDKGRPDRSVIIDLEDIKQTVASIRPIVSGLLDRQRLSENLPRNSLTTVNSVKTAIVASSFVQADNIPTSFENSDETGIRQANMLLSNGSNVENIIDPALGIGWSQMQEIFVPTPNVDESSPVGCRSSANKVVDTNSGFDKELLSSKSKPFGVDNHGKQVNYCSDAVDTDDASPKQSEFSSESKLMDSVDDKHQDLSISDPKYSNSGHTKLENMISLESKMFDKFRVVNNESNKPNFTYQLQNDLFEIIQSLQMFTASQFIDLEDLNELNTFYSDLQHTVVGKIEFIENFVQNEEFKKFPRHRIKHLRKMVYSLINSLDAIMKRSTKISQKRNKPRNSLKFFKDLSKIIFNFNKNWSREQNVWSQNLERARQKEQRSNRFKDSNKRKKNHKTGSKILKRRNLSKKEFNSKHKKHYLKA